MDPTGPVISWAQQFPEYESVPPSGQRPGPERTKGPRLRLFPRPSGLSINRLDSEPGLGGWDEKGQDQLPRGPKEVLGTLLPFSNKEVINRP